MGNPKRDLVLFILILFQRLGGLMCFVIAAYLFAARETWQAVQMLTLAFVIGIEADVTDMKRRK